MSMRLPRRWALVIGAASVALGVPASSDSGREVQGNDSDHSRHVLILTIDTLRADYLSSRGYELLTTPALDELSRTSTTFSHALTTSPRTTPALASLLTGRYPHGTGVRSLLDRLSQEATSIAEVASDNGYNTLAVISNHILTKDRGLGRGFDLYDSAGDHRSAAATTAATKTALSGLNAKDRIFLWVHYIDPHVPYIPKRETVNSLLPKYQGLYSHQFGQYIGGIGDAAYPKNLPKPLAVFKNSLPERVNARIRQLYAADIRDTDNAVADLLSWLRAKFGDDWTIVFTSDHGEALGERDYYYYDHGDYVFNATTRIPLGIQLPPRHIHHGAHEVDDWVSLIDITPTLIELLDWEVPAKVTSNFEGRSLVPYFRKTTLPPRSVFAECGSSFYPSRIRGRVRFDVSGRFRAVWKGDWKLIWTPFAPPNQEYQLYNMKQDPDERENVAGEHPQEVNALREDLAEWMKRSSGVEAQHPPSRKEIEALRSLGYVE